MIPAFSTPPRFVACLPHHSSYKWSDRPDPECFPQVITAQMRDSEAESGRDHMANQDS
jgi:hypothetical protein